ncbi:serine protease [Jannaschia sp. S6380]|uniref:serine protease n=1 Tax=Jannaschia sp. S6380 TaxID=2926408 RepID=UPI001FF38CEB|nr:serine protease [Jannaschia sp. S6380]MCK0168115.1 serine protease [Jannaschia sp. S6380]
MNAAATTNPFRDLDRITCTMQRMIRIALLLLLVAFPIQADPSDRFDANRLTREDTRFLQAALSFSGFYVGLIDGAWGARSADALRAAAGPTPTEAEVLLTLHPFIADFETATWQDLNLEGTSALLPIGILIRDEGPDYAELRTPDRDLIVRHIWRTADGTSEMHRWLEQAHTAPVPVYRADTAEAYVTKGRLPSGDEVYLRTITRGGYFETVLVQWSRRQAARARVVVASLTNSRVDPLVLPDYGYFAAMMESPPRGSAPPAAGVSNERSTGSGTGFYVNDTDIVTAAHVVSECARLSLADNSPLLLLAAEKKTDLAVLRAARRSNSWLELGTEVRAALGAPIVAVGFPYAGMFRQGLSVTRGNVSAMKGLAGEDHVLTFTAPVQPGNSGGPLLDGDGRVIGVISYRASDLWTLEQSGTIPQNMNAATALEPLRQFLAKARVEFTVPDTPSRDLSRGLPMAITDPVVAVQCHPS